jgi:hypothetical protein
MSLLNAGEEVAEAAAGGVSSIFGGWQLTLIAAVLSAGMAGYGAWTVKDWKDSGTITTLQSDVKSAGDNLVVSKGNTQTAWDAYGRLDTSLKGLKTDSDTRSADADAALAKLAGDKATLNKSLDALLHAKPAQGADMCKAADDLILGYTQ